MVNNAFLAATLILLFSLPANAAEPSAYCSLSGGAWLPGKTAALDSNFLPVDISYRDGWSVGGAVGLVSGKGLRLESEIVYAYSVSFYVFATGLIGEPNILWGFVGFILFGLFCKWITRDVPYTPGWSLRNRDKEKSQTASI